MGMTELDRKLGAAALLGRRVEGDRLVLADAVLAQALDGSRPLTDGERAALQGSPLTLRRFRRLAEARRASMRPAAPAPAPAPARHAAWQGSSGLLRAADGGAGLAMLRTGDGMWRLHFVGAGGGLAVILQLDPQAPGAAPLLAARPRVAVRDGAGALVLAGALDADGECEGRWPFAAPPASHFQRHGAAFSVEPSAGSPPALPTTT